VCSSDLRWETVVLGLYVVAQGHLLELLTRFFSVMLDKVVDNVLLESELDGNIPAKQHLAVEDVLIGKDQVDARHEVVELLFHRQSPQRFNGFRIPDKFIHHFFGELTVSGDLEDHLPFALGKVLVGLGQLNENVQLFLGDYIHRRLTWVSKVLIRLGFFEFLPLNSGIGLPISLWIAPFAAGKSRWRAVWPVALKPGLPDFSPQCCILCRGRARSGRSEVRP